MSTKQKAIFLMINYIPMFLVTIFFGLAFLLKELFQINYFLWYSLYVVFFIYFVPVILFRIFLFFTGPLKEGIFSKSGNELMFWWVSSQFQILYNRFPAFEELLRVFPMLYSNWLKLWGAQIGKNIFWAPNVVIVDRGLIEVGDQVVFGYGARLSSHALTPNEFIIGKSKVKANAIIGGLAGVGPGSIVAENEMLPFDIKLLLFTEWKNNKKNKLN